MSPAGRFHLGVSLDGAGRHPAAWRVPDGPRDLFGADHLVRLARDAERGALDFVVLEDSFDRPAAGGGRLGGRLDALLSLARVAPVTQFVGLIAAVSTTHTEPFHVSKNVATLDHVSLGRAGWKVTVSTTEADAERFGRKPVASLDELYAEASDAIEVVARLWDSWEDDAVIRDQPTGRYVDRAKLHYVDFEGPFFSVRGPSITPRSPQGQPLVAIDATSGPAMRVAGERADLAFVEQADAASARATRDEVRAIAGAAGRDPESVAVLATIDVLLGPDGEQARAERAHLDDLAGSGPSPSGALDYIGAAPALADLMEEWYRAGAVDGFVIRPALLPRGLSQLVDEVVPILQARGLVRATYDGPTLRDHFGLSRPSNRYAGGSVPS